MENSNLIVVGAFAVWLLPLIGAAYIVGWRYRRSLRPRPGPPEPPRPEEPGEFRDGPELRFVCAKDVGSVSPGSAAEQARAEAKRVNEGVRRSYVTAWLVFAAVVTALLGAYTVPKWRWDAKLASICFFLVPQLVIFTWSLRLPLPRRSAISAIYAAASIVLVLLLSDHGLLLVIELFPFFALVPLAALAFFFVRRMQPLLVLIVASMAQFVGLGLLIVWLVPIVIDEGARVRHGWILVAGFAAITLGVIIGTALLRLRGRTRMVGFLAALAGADLYLYAVLSRLPDALIIIGVLCVTILQAYMLWFIFKFISWFQERRFLTIEILRIGLCWFSLALYLVAWTVWTGLFVDKAVARAVLAAAVIVSLAILLAMLSRLRSSRPPPPPRLLLLRVFGRADEREDLLDHLNDTWLRIGPVDLIGGVDVATRTLQSSMLEAFLLRRSDEQFLEDEGQVEKRLQKRPSDIEADARYPVNPVYCYEAAWRPAFVLLAKGAAVHLMDVRGFTADNKGCELELTYLLKHTALQRIVLLYDGRTDRQALENVARKAWMALPPDSPNLRCAERDLTVLDFSRKSDDDRRALFDLLLNAAY